MKKHQDIKNISKGSCKADKGTPDLGFFSSPYICNNSSKKYDPFTILSFSLLFKRIHTQGHFPLKKMTLRQFYNNSPIRKVISFYLFKKNFLALKELNLLNKFHSGTYQLKSLNDILDVINPELDSRKLNKYQKILKNYNFKDIKSFKEYKDTLAEALILRELDRQKYHVENHNKKVKIAKKIKDDRLVGRDDIKISKKIVKEAKKKQISFQKYIELLSNSLDKIVTGCIHLGNKLNLHFIYTNKAINRLKNKGIINRFIVKEPIHYSMLDYTKNSYFCITRKRAYKVLGSVVELNI